MSGRGLFVASVAVFTRLISPAPTPASAELPFLFGFHLEQM